jgi:hypothetical protein
MKLRPIDADDTDLAADLLAAGFPTRSRDMWLTSLLKLVAHGETMPGRPVGQFLIAGDKPVGICLTIPATRTAFDEEPHLAVNIACFYLEQAHQWQATLAMRRLVADGAVEYTDLTASPTMRQINLKNGFTNLSEGSVLIPLPVAALLPSRRARFVPLKAIPPLRLSDAHTDLLTGHAELGCICGAVQIDTSLSPVIFAPTRRRGAPGARLILARDKTLIRNALGPIARHLLRYRLAFLEFEAQSSAGFPGAIFRRDVAPYQSTRNEPSDVVDHTFSELVFFQPFVARRLME